MISKKNFFGIRCEFWVCVFLAIATLAVYGQVINHEFVDFDDELYVTDNSYLKTGTSSEIILWICNFTNKQGAYWQPLTWLSHALDYHLYGLNSGMHHLTSLMLHIANAILLFLVLNRMTGALWRSAYVAALFALHPLNAESVAWISERKNVLSTFFWMLTMLTYVRYIERPSFFKYLPVFLTFLLGLLTKPMLVTLPFALLLLDYWPLNRWKLETGNWKLITEKLPLFALAAISVYLSVSSLQPYNNIASAENVSITLRIANALVSYTDYLWKMVCPVNLAAYYPFPETLPAYQTAGAGVFLICVSVLVILELRHKPYLIIGWLWYLGTLVPVIGLVQAGDWPALADRWTYIPLIGIFVIIAWGIPDLLARWCHKAAFLTMTAAVTISILMGVTWLQAGYWRNSIALFQRMTDTTENNAFAYDGLGFALAKQGRTEEALAHHREALHINPDYVSAHDNIGRILLTRGNIKDAIAHFEQALEINQNHVKAHNNIGIALANQGKTAEAATHFQKVIQISPDNANACYNLAKILKAQGNLTEAAAYLQKAISVRPDFADAHYNLGTTLMSQGKVWEAVTHFQKASQIRPDDAQSHTQLAIALTGQGKTKDAFAHFRKALEISPDDANMQYNMGVVLFNMRKFNEAVVHFQKALQINPDHADANSNLRRALSAGRGL